MAQALALAWPIGLGCESFAPKAATITSPSRDFRTNRLSAPDEVIGHEVRGSHGTPAPVRDPSSGFPLKLTHLLPDAAEPLN